MEELDLDHDRKVVQAAIAKAPKDGVGLDKLHEDLALAKGLPPYGYLLQWESPWVSPSVYLFAVTGVGHTPGWGKTYYAYFVKDLTPRKQGEEEGVVLLRRSGAKMGHNFKPGCCNGKIHPIEAHNMAFTKNALIRRFEEMRRRHLNDLEREGVHVLQAIEELGKRAAYLNEQRAAVRDHQLIGITKCPEKTTSKSKASSKKRAGAASTASRSTKAGRKSSPNSTDG